MPLHRQPKTTYSTLFPGLNFPSVTFFKALAFTCHLGWLSGLVPYPKKYRWILPLHGLGSVSEGPGSIFCLLVAVSEVLKGCKVNVMCWLHNTGTASPTASVLRMKDSAAAGPAMEDWCDPVQLGKRCNRGYPDMKRGLR